MLVIPFISSASAADLVDPDNIDAITKYFGVDLSDPASIQKFIDQLENGGASALLNILGIDISEILAELETYLNTMETTTVDNAVEDSSVTGIEEQTTTIVVIEETTAEKHTYTTYPSYNYEQEATSEKILPVKPSNKKTTAETVTEKTTDKSGITTESSSTTESTTKNDSEISAKTVLIVLLTLFIFVTGLCTGTIVTKKISEKSNKSEE